MKVFVCKLKNSFSKYLHLLQLDGVKWNGKKPLGGGKNRSKISSKTAAEYVLEDRR